MKYLLLLVLISLLVGCNADISQENVTTNETSDIINDSLNVTACTEQWTCISSTIRSLRLDNCSLSIREECNLGCKNGNCTLPKSCEPGFKCKGKHYTGFQSAACDWVSTKKCDYGCENAECLPKPNVTISEVEEKVEESVVASSTISFGEEVIIGNSSLEIYFIEEGKVKLTIDERKSNWLVEGDSFTGSDITIQVHEILVQQHLGGKQQISYSIK